MRPLLADIEDRRWLLEELRFDCRKAVKAGRYWMVWDEDIVQSRLQRGIAVGEPIRVFGRTCRYIGNGQIRSSILSDGVIHRNGQAERLEIAGETIRLTRESAKALMRFACLQDLAAAADDRFIYGRPLKRK